MLGEGPVLGREAVFAQTRLLADAFPAQLLCYMLYLLIQFFELRQGFAFLLLCLRDRCLYHFIYYAFGK